MKVNKNIITAEEGKVLQRISDEMIFGKELYLGYTYYLGGELLDEPLYELPEHYQEIDETEIDEPENKSLKEIKTKVKQDFSIL